MTPYLQHLQATPTTFQNAIEHLLSRFHVLPVGNGYIDLIVPTLDALLLIDQLAELSVAVHYVTWWCYCTPESKMHYGCPHGMGGPVNPRGEGWFSECVNYPEFDVLEHTTHTDAEPKMVVQRTQFVLHTYLTEHFPCEPFYSPCLWPGLWLYVPEDWQRQWYAI